MNGIKINPTVIYPLVSERDELWGVSVTSIGHQKIAPNEIYPPGNHPLSYFFDFDNGRILNEYQLLYITKGKGVFAVDNFKKSRIITKGKMFLLMPGVWHTYKPNKETGWNEYWIGFKGEIIERIVREGFFLNRTPVFNIGNNEMIIDLFYKGIEISHKERAGFQQELSGILMHILGLMYAWDMISDFEEDILNKINKAKVIMQEVVYNKITAEDVAKNVGISYSGFRRAFKKFTGTSPSKYMRDLKLNEAKLLLSKTSMSIKDISCSLNFENPNYFFIFFKKRTGQSPKEYKHFTFSN